MPMPQPTPAIITLATLAGAAVGFLVQQAIDVWKTTRAHRYNLQSRFFEIKLQTAIDLTQALNTVVSLFKARLAEAEEWTREDEQFRKLSGVQHVVRMHGDKLQAEFHRFHNVQAMVHLVFPSTFLAEGAPPPIGTELNAAWGEFDSLRGSLLTRLNDLLPPERFSELAKQGEEGRFDPRAHAQMEAWLTAYKDGVGVLRVRLHRLQILTDEADRQARDSIRAIRSQLEPYSA